MERRDLIIIGGGPAGLGCAIYAARYNLKTAVFAKMLGGIIVNSNDVGNWPGFQKITGLELMNTFRDHALSLGVEIIEEEVTLVEKAPDGFTITAGGEKYEAHAVLLALGSKRRTLDVPGEDRLSGRGVHYCATCDAPFYKKKVCAVVGGGDSAALGAEEVAEHADKVYLIHRRDTFRAEPLRINRLRKNPKVEFVLNSSIKEIKGEKKVSSIILSDGRELAVDAVFVEVGSDPINSFAKSLGCALDENGLVKVRPDQMTSVEGVWCAGDLSDASNRFRQALTAASEGSIAAESVYRYVTEKKSMRG